LGQNSALEEIIWWRAEVINGDPHTMAFLDESRPRFDGARTVFHDKNAAK